MDEASGIEEPSMESQFARTIKYIDIYLQQKTDLLLQHYVFEPVDFLLRQIMYLSVIVTLLAAGTFALVLGVILFIATLVPLWAALLIIGAAIFILGGIIAYLVLSNKIILKTPLATEMIENGKP
ncbi:MAG: phage holin family protein [Methanoregula sp.]|jgi:hypothetical protein